MPLNELAVTERIAGEREVRRALEKKNLKKLFIALDSDLAGAGELEEAAKTAGVEVEKVDSKLKLGRACAIDRPAAVAGLLMHP
ncbi:MAG: ribosomal L7Ae/L30e/S12e/Gadd45 family protein [Synergistaceae bacterium]|jgi:large subunit ribosomal protein L7A|nr:ribosomal L7Ae/L30e/S12e/Gadd45 family protein [Synergistaceae bacterium]